MAKAASYIWLLEAPQIPGYYALPEPVRRGKLGGVIEHGTHNASEAIAFQSIEDAEEWMRGHPQSPPWRPTEHGFGG